RGRRNGPGLSIVEGRVGGFDEDADLAVFLVAAVEKSVERDVDELAEVAEEEGLESGGGLAMVAVGAAERLRDDLVDDPEAEQVLAGELERGGGLGGVFATFPEDRRTAFGADHRVIRVL